MPPNTTDSDAIAYRNDWGSARVYVVDPFVKVMRGNAIVSEPASARVAGLIAKIDNERGFWWSPSNNPINGILGTHRAVDFALGDANARANLLNASEVAILLLAPQNLPLHSYRDSQTRALCYQAVDRQLL